MRNRFVKVERVAWADGHVSYRYRAMEIRNGNTYDLGGSSAEPEEAFDVIAEIEAREVRT
jgi:hypothetical protein